MPGIVIFASGNGSTAQALIDFSQKYGTFKVLAIACPNPKAFVVQRAHLAGIPVLKFSRTEMENRGAFQKHLNALGPDLIVLAGFLWLLPKWLMADFPNRILNIHPALLPKFGGKGMYGDKVHIAVLDAGEADSGTTVHLVNERYDEGQILASFPCPVPVDRKVETLRLAVQNLEQYWYPRVVEWYLQKEMAGTL